MKEIWSIKFEDISNLRLQKKIKIIEPLYIRNW